VTDLPVLTEDAEQIAVAEKNGSGPELAHQRVFFAEMRAETGNHGFVAGAAKSQLPVAAIHPALMRTDLAGEHDVVSRVDPLLQEAGAVSLQVCRFK
jgi:hypothetical protein